MPKYFIKFFLFYKELIISLLLFKVFKKLWENTFKNMSNSPIEDGEIRDNIIDRVESFSNNCNQDNYESVSMEMDSDTG